MDARTKHIELNEGKNLVRVASHVEPNGSRALLFLSLSLSLSPREKMTLTFVRVHATQRYTERNPAQPRQVQQGEKQKKNLNQIAN